MSRIVATVAHRNDTKYTFRWRSVILENPFENGTVSRNANRTCTPGSTTRSSFSSSMSSRSWRCFSSSSLDEPPCCPDPFDDESSAIRGYIPGGTRTDPTGVARRMGETCGWSPEDTPSAAQRPSPHGDAIPADRHDLAPEATGLYFLVTGNQPPGRRDHAPPRQPLGRGQDVHAGTGRPGVPGLLRDLGVRGHLTRPEADQDLADPLFELAYRFPRSSCSRSMARNSSLKFPSPKPLEPWRSMTS